MKALVISSGTINNYSILKSIVKESDFIVCADGGMDHLMKINRLPDLLLGDLDSISNDALDYVNENNIKIQKYSSIKDSTDTELAIEYLIEKGIRDITLIGVTGTRQDHTIANILLLSRLHDKDIKGKIVDDNNIIYLIDDYLELEYQKETYISILPITEDGIEVSLTGFYYNLNDQIIEFGSTIGISNKIVDGHGVIKIHKGKAIVFISKD